MNKPDMDIEDLRARERENALQECNRDLRDLWHDLIRATDNLSRDLAVGDITPDEFERDFARLQAQSDAKREMIRAAIAALLREGE
jgi:hypothetical protein